MNKTFNRSHTGRKPYTPPHSLVVIVGNYGSGKTEIAVNLSFYLRKRGAKVAIADLDVVNPYFRCREPGELMEAAGIRVVIPPGNRRFADLPIVVPEIKGMLQVQDQPNQYAIFDVGGDDVGATMLSSLVEALGDRPYSLFQVINARRPFTDTVEGCLKMKSAIETASRMRVTGLISNTHLSDETTGDVVLEGLELTTRVSEDAGVPVEFVSVMEYIMDDELERAIQVPILRLERIMTPPWLEPRREDEAWHQHDARPSSLEL